MKMKYFNESKDDIDGYMKSLELLKGILDQGTYQFMINHSFHDSWINQLTVLNKEGADDSKISPVSVQMHLTYWDNQKYELLWENVSKYSTDFDIMRNKVVETGQVLFERGLDQWSHDELLLTVKGDLSHEIMLFSQTRIMIECKQFSIKKLD